MPGASQAGAWPTKHSLLTTNYEPKSPSRRASDRSDEKIVIVRGALYSDVGRLPLSGGRARCIQPPDRRLVDGHHLAHSGRTRRPRHGAPAAAAERRDPPFGSWLAIYLDRVRQTMSGGGRPSLDGVGRGCLRQRNGGELLRHARMRVARSASLQDAGRGTHCRLRVHRGFLQSAPTTLIARLSVTHQVRAPICRGEPPTRCTRACCRARACGAR